MPLLSPSVTKASSPMTGDESLLVTGLPFERSTVPAGTMRSGRFPPSGGSRLGIWMGRGVPANSGFGRSSLSGTLSSARKSAVAASKTSKAEQKRFMVEFGGKLGDEIRGSIRQQFL